MNFRRSQNAGRLLSIWPSALENMFETKLAKLQFKFRILSFKIHIYLILINLVNIKKSKIYLFSFIHLPFDFNIITCILF